MAERNLYLLKISTPDTGHRATWPMTKVVAATKDEIAALRERAEGSRSYGLSAEVLLDVERTQTIAELEAEMEGLFDD